MWKVLFYNNSNSFWRFNSTTYKIFTLYIRKHLHRQPFKCIYLLGFILCVACSLARRYAIKFLLQSNHSTGVRIDWTHWKCWFLVITNAILPISLDLIGATDSRYRYITKTSIAANPLYTYICEEPITKHSKYKSGSACYLNVILCNSMYI